MNKTLLICMISAVSPWLFAQPRAPRQIHDKGCVRQGVEAGCLLVVTLDANTTYNILVAKDRPKVGDMIEFWGTEFHGATICMHGKPVKVDKWTRLDTQCPQPSSPEQ
jgi:hypothetical protein